MRLVVRVAPLVLLAACLPASPRPPVTPSAEDPSAWFAHGVALLQAEPRDVAGAYAAFDHASVLFDATSDPRAAKAHFDAAWSAEALGRLDDAERHDRAAYAVDPGWEPAVRSLARVLVARGRPEDAVLVLAPYADAHPSADVRDELAEDLLASGRTSEAVDVAREVLVADGDDVGALRVLAHAYHASGQDGLARLCAERALAASPDDPAVLEDLAALDVASGDTEAAVGRWKQALSADPSRYVANMDLGTVALAGGDVTLAKTSFERALASSPNDRDAVLALAAAEQAGREWDAARGTLDRWLAAHPDDAEAASRRAGVEAAASAVVARSPKKSKPPVDLRSLDALQSDAGAIAAALDAHAGCAAVDALRDEVTASYLDPAAQIVAEGDAETAKEALDLGKEYRRRVDEAVGSCGR